MIVTQKQRALLGQLHATSEHRKDAERHAEAMLALCLITGVPVSDGEAEDLRRILVLIGERIDNASFINRIA